MFRKIVASLLAACALGAIAVTNVYAAVEVNSASQAELETVKGIGPGLAGKIMKAREAGAFKDWADMVRRVPGVGPGNAAKFAQAGLQVGGAALDPASLPADTPRARKTADRAQRAERGERGERAERTERASRPAKAAAANAGETTTAAAPAAASKRPRGAGSPARQD